MTSPVHRCVSWPQFLASLLTVVGIVVTTMVLHLRQPHGPEITQREIDLIIQQLYHLRAELRELQGEMRKGVDKRPIIMQ